MTRDASSGYLQLTDLEDIESHPCCNPKDSGMTFAAGPKRFIKLHEK